MLKSFLQLMLMELARATGFVCLSLHVTAMLAVGSSPTWCHEQPSKNQALTAFRSMLDAFRAVAHPSAWSVARRCLKERATSSRLQTPLVLSDDLSF